MSSPSTVQYLLAKPLDVSRRVALAAVGLTLLVSCGGDQILVTDTQTPDPVVVDIPVAYIKRALPVDDNGELITQDLRRPYEFLPGSALYLKPRASASAEETNLTDRAFAAQVSEDPEQPAELAYDVKDLEVSYDGQKLLFAMRAPERDDLDDDEQPTWNIWEYAHETGELRRIIASDIEAEAGQDTAPVYLPDGRIVFSSTRQAGNQANLLDEGKPQYQGLEESLREPASVLHVMQPDGSNITQISFNQSHDLDPTVLQNGKILFSRWDQAGNNNSIHLYQMNADGSGLEIMYGKHSHNNARSEQPVQFVDARELPDGQVLSALTPYQSGALGGDFVNIDIANFIDTEQPIAAQEGRTDSAESPALFDDIQIDEEISPGGKFAAVYPLWDGSGRVLFSWSQCRVFDPEQELAVGEPRTILPCTTTLLEQAELEAAPPLFGLWMYDPADNTQLTLGVPEEGVYHSEIVAMEPRPFPNDRQQADNFDAALADDSLARVHIRSVYDFAGEDTSANGIAVLADPQQTTADARPVQFLRVVKAVSMPDDEVRDFDNSAFGRSRAQLMREIIGYVPVEPDGSVLFDVPANLPLAFSLLDGNGRRVGERHQNWLQFAPGEVRTCNGCHTSDSLAPHGREDAEPVSINPGAVTTGAPFVNTNPALFADFGETMAEVAGRINGVHRLVPDLIFDDIWTDPATSTPAPAKVLAYADLSTPLPVTTSCAVEWQPVCRIQPHYPQHIQPIFSLSREQIADDGVTLVEDFTCVSCHSAEDQAGMPQVPAAQLDLRGLPSSDNPDHLIGYRELMFGDNEQELVEGALIDRLVEVLDGEGNPVFEVDEDGELILDAEGNPIPRTRTIGVRNSMSPNGARASNRFFAPFDGGSHAGWLSPAELRLIAEWLDIGGQYYNDPFVAPAD